MSNRRYMEFDSTYRNRNCYPCPAEFKTQLTCTKTEEGGTGAQDYIAQAYPTTSWFQAPYAGEDLKAFAGDVGGTDQAVIKIPRSINNQTFTSLWPINWLQGSDPTYLSNFDNLTIVANRAATIAGNGQGQWTSGVRGASMVTPLAAFAGANVPDWDPNFLNDRFIRIQNVVAPVNFSGGTADAPQLGAIALQTGTTDDYFTGALLMRFTTNPLLEPLPNPGSAGPPQIPLLGSLGQAFYYQEITMSTPPPVPLTIGDKLDDGGLAEGYIACIISDSRFVVRLGTVYANADQPTGTFATTAQWPPYAGNVNPFGIVNTVDLTPLASGIALPWDIPTIVTTQRAEYRYCGFVETSIISSYDASTGVATLTTPFLSGGPNAFTPGVGNDFYLIDFNTDPTGYWPQVQQGKPRIFFPGGAAIPNYYSGVFIENITYDVNYSGLLGIQEGKVSSYALENRLLYLDPETKFQRASPSDRGATVVSASTVVFLANSVSSPELPIGSMVTYLVAEINQADGSQGANQLHPFRVALTKPSGNAGTAVVFTSSFDPTGSDPFTGGGPGTAPSLLRLASPIPVRVSIPPWYKNIPLAGFGAYENLYDYWSDQNNLSSLETIPLADGPVSLGGFFGAESLVVRGKSGILPQQALVPFEPFVAEATPLTLPFVIREHSVFNLALAKGGQSYTTTRPGMPAMALISIPNDFIPPFTGMSPVPEQIEGVYTFLNICWVDITAVDHTGGITAFHINTPGYGYTPGTLLYIVQGEGGNMSRQNSTGTAPHPGPNGNYTFQKSPGFGAQVKVITSQFSISVAGGEKLRSIPEPGCAIYMPTYGHGLDDLAAYIPFGDPGGLRPATVYNQAPRVAEYIINFSSTLFDSSETLNQFREYGRVLKDNQYPRRAQNCKVDDQTFPETGVRIIDNVIKSVNNQILIAENISITTGIVNNLQYYAPGTYLGGVWKTITPANVAVEGINDVLWMGMAQGFDLSNFKGRYSIASTEYVNPNLAWLPEFEPLFSADIFPGETVNTDTNVSSVPSRIAFIDHRAPPTTFPGSSSFVAGLMNMSGMATANILQILAFDKDSSYPMNYTGSTVSQNQMVCYEIELISLILPNKPLDNAIGGLIAFYPYLYVELSNVSAPSSGMKGIIYSNNPNANRALFRVGIDDTPTPAISAFIKVDGNGAVQTVKFKPNDNLYFRVYLQNGELYQTQDKDTTPPTPPDVFVQISAEFSIKRLT